MEVSSWNLHHLKKFEQCIQINNKVENKPQTISIYSSMSNCPSFKRLSSNVLQRKHSLQRSNEQRVSTIHFFVHRHDINQSILCASAR